MKAYSMDLRERIVAACLAGERVVVVAQRFGVGERTVRTYRARAAVGELSPRPLPGKPARLRADQEAELVALVEQKPDWTIEQLSQEWHKRSGVLLPRSTLHDHLKRLGGRYKKRVELPSNAAR